MPSSTLPRQDTDGPMSIVASLKTCARLKDLQRGSSIHVDIARRGLVENNVFVGNSLINMYAKCGALTKAREAFDALQLRDVVSWNVLIAAYAQHGHAQEALTCFEWMQVKGFAPSAATFLSILSACVIIRAAEKRHEIYAQIMREGFFERDITIANAVIDMFGKCGLLAKAQEAFDKLHMRNVISWNSLLAGYAQHGHIEEAMSCFDEMQSQGYVPDAVTFLCMLKTCGSRESLDKGQTLHSEVVRRGLLKTDVMVVNAFIDMYGKCGEIAKAQEVFDEVSSQNIVSWNALIAGYVQHGHEEEAYVCFDRIPVLGLLPNEVTFLCILKACVTLRAVEKAHRMHALIAIDGSLGKDCMLNIALVDTYSKCGSLEKAEEVFGKLPFRNIASWNSLILGYSQLGQNGRALDLFESMQVEGLTPDMITLSVVLRACGDLEEADQGQEVHAKLVTEGLLQKDTMIANALIHMYAKCGLINKAQEVFDKLSTPDVATWNVLLSGYTQVGHGEEALLRFKLMQSKGHCPDVVTFVHVLKACAIIGALEKGRELHAWIKREGLLTDDMVIGTALVDMYLSCSRLAEAQEVFYRLAWRDAISWNVFVEGFAQRSNNGSKALDLFERMHREGVAPNEVTFLGILKACGNIGAAHRGQAIHAEISRVGILEEDSIVGTALIDMYSNTGMLAFAQEAFSSLPCRDAVAWAALITGYAQYGVEEDVISLLAKMIDEGKEPDTVTFTAVLNVCSHGGLVDECQMYFRATTSTSHEIIPTLEHFTCMVDLFGRAGLLDKAVLVIKGMPFFDDATVWHNLMGACQKWSNTEVGGLAFEHAAGLDESDALACVCLRNIYEAAGRQELATRLIL